MSKFFPLNALVTGVRETLPSREEPSSRNTESNANTSRSPQRESEANTSRSRQRDLATRKVLSWLWSQHSHSARPVSAMFFETTPLDVNKNKAGLPAVNHAKSSPQNSEHHAPLTDLETAMLWISTYQDKSPSYDDTSDSDDDIGSRKSSAKKHAKSPDNKEPITDQNTPIQKQFSHENSLEENASLALAWYEKYKDKNPGDNGTEKKHADSNTRESLASPLKAREEIYDSKRLVAIESFNPSIDGGTAHIERQC